ncbi:serine-type D-Ala-D-Ala carboxypeptidase, partial [Salmonella enterica subsp. enterica serovar Poona]
GTTPRGQRTNLTASFTLNEPQLTAPLKKGQVVGTIDFQLNGKSIEQRPLMVMENDEEGGFFSPMWVFWRIKQHQSDGT